MIFIFDERVNLLKDPKPRLVPQRFKIEQMKVDATGVMKVCCTVPQLKRDSDCCRMRIVLLQAFTLSVYANVGYRAYFMNHWAARLSTRFKLPLFADSKFLSVGSPAGGSTVGILVGELVTPTDGPSLGASVGAGGVLEGALLTSILVGEAEALTDGPSLGASVGAVGVLEGALLTSMLVGEAEAPMDGP